MNVADGTPRDRVPSQRNHMVRLLTFYMKKAITLMLFYGFQKWLVEMVS
jgi:hypothetical protein